MGNVHMEASQINYRGGETKMSVEEALKSTSGEAAAIAALQVAVGNLQNGKADMSVIAPAFSAETAYSVGDIVSYDGAAYRCTTAHEGVWNAEDFTATTISGEIASANGDIADLNGTKANQITIAPFFSVETAYDPGDIVYYNGLSYRCVNAHEGEWDADDFAATTIAGELDTLKSGLTNKVGCTLIATTEATGTNKSKLNSLFAAYNALSQIDKFNAFIAYGNTRLLLAGGYAFASTQCAFNGIDPSVIYSALLDASDSKFALVSFSPSGGYSVTDQSDVADSNQFYLYTLN